MSSDEREPRAEPQGPEAAARAAQQRRGARMLMMQRVRRALPWVLFVAAILVAGIVGPSVSGLGVSPGAALAREVSLVSARVARVLEVKKRVGDHVDEGEVVLVLDPAEIDREIAVAKKELDRFELEVAARAGSLKRDDLLNRERLASDSERAALEVARVRSAAQRDSAELSTLDAQIKRQRELVEQRLASQQTLDELVLRRAALAEEVRESETLVRRAEEHRRATRARYDELRAQTTSGAAGDPAIAPYRAAAAAQKERLSVLEAHKEALTLRAPFSGRLATLLIEPGGVALAEVPLASVVEERPARVVAYVDERKSRRIARGDRVEVSASDRSGNAHKGSVVALGPRVAEIPVRFRKIPAEPEFGREIFIGLDEELDVLPGQAFDVIFTGPAK